jgi:hypothetical protein
MAAKKASDGVELAGDGRVVLTMDGVARTLRRPKIGELRTLFGNLDEVSKLEKETGSVLSALGDTADALAGWWATVVDMLGVDCDPLPGDPDDLPVWLLSGDLIGKVTSHWREVPYLSGG